MVATHNWFLDSSGCPLQPGSSGFQRSWFVPGPLNARVFVGRQRCGRTGRLRLVVFDHVSQQYEHFIQRLSLKLFVPLELLMQLIDIFAPRSHIRAHLLKPLLGIEQLLVCRLELAFGNLQGLVLLSDLFLQGRARGPRSANSSP